MYYDVYANKDAYISSARPNNNYGNASDLLVSMGTAYDGNCYALFNFDLSTVPAEVLNNSTHNVYACFYAACDSLGVRRCFIRRVISAWNENFVTWATQPTYESQNARQFDFPSDVYSWVSIGMSEYSFEIIDFARRGIKDYPLILLPEIDDRGTEGRIGARENNKAAYLRFEYVGSNDITIISASEQGQISNKVLGIKAAVIQGQINKNIIGMSIAPTLGQINKKVFLK